MPQSQPPSSLRTVFRLAAAFTFLAVVMGSLVCATESGAACPTWPGCYTEQFTPEFHLNPLVEFTHRVVAVTSGPLLLVAAIMSRRLPRRATLARTLPWVALVGALAAAIFGRIVVLSGLPRWWGVVDLACALTAMLAIGTATIALEHGAYRWRPTRLGRLAFTGTGLILVMHLFGIILAGTGSYTRCMGWPVWSIIDTDHSQGWQVARLALAMASIAIIAAVVAHASRIPHFRVHGYVLAGLLVLEMILGAILLSSGITLLLTAAYSTTAVTVLWVLGLLAARASFTGASNDAPAQPRDPALTH